MRRRVFAAIGALSSEDGIERPSAGAAPTAFRVWRSGDNATDYGVHKFTARSASLLMSEQSSRGNLYSIDADHMSLNKESPPESRKAVGWHRLEVRQGAGGPELWATHVEWTEGVRAGLEKSPPEWRYFSPAYDVDKETSEIVSYLNTAITNNPATHSVTALAARAAKGTMKMSYEEAMAALTGDDPEKKAMAEKCIKAAFGEPDGDEGETDEEKKKREEAAKAAAAAPAIAASEEPDKAGEPKDKVAAAKAKVTASALDPATKAALVEALGTVGALEKDAAERTKREEGEERARILAARPDLTDGQKKLLAGLPIETMRETVAAFKGADAANPDPAAAARVTATRGDTQAPVGAVTEVQFRAARLPPAENAELRGRMGTQQADERVHWRGTSMVFPAITKVEAARRLKILEARGQRRPGATEGGR